MSLARLIALIVTLVVASRFVAFGADDGFDRDQGTPIWVFDHGYHAGLVIARSSLSKFEGARSQVWLAQFPEADWFEFGWGDTGFYFEVPAYENVTLAIGAKALLWPSDSVMHISTGSGTPFAVFSHSDGVEIPVTDDALVQMLAFIESGAATDVPLGPGLYGVSRFYQGRGAYHLFQTCNSWVSQALRAGDVRSAPGPSVLSAGLLWDLKRRYN
ncbi:uncharacterized protein (TIGR02117 family) [Shimia isoporae]|uniref:Uncharacterized protein (TIGR02117 family) n=1 Tax=Shimia isoporae TaxID=647720 RepID=A0A4R1NLN6_9RHOB|nr:DUF2459 domain-containing protein [Shimia isoporae]TCL09287.1 uncharacterized protein (TIGR02117 family) [Shimia isoporae]